VKKKGERKGHNETHRGEKALRKGSDNDLRTWSPREPIPRWLTKERTVTDTKWIASAGQEGETEEHDCT